MRLLYHSLKNSFIFAHIENEIISEYKQYWIYLKTELTKFHKNLFEISKLPHHKNIHSFIP